MKDQKQVKQHKLSEDRKAISIKNFESFDDKNKKQTKPPALWPYLKNKSKQSRIEMNNLQTKEQTSISHEPHENYQQLNEKASNIKRGNYTIGKSFIIPTFQGDIISNQIEIHPMEAKIIQMKQEYQHDSIVQEKGRNTILHSFISPQFQNSKINSNINTQLIFQSCGSQPTASVQNINEIFYKQKSNHTDVDKNTLVAIRSNGLVKQEQLENLEKSGNKGEIPQFLYTNQFSDLLSVHPTNNLVNGENAVSVSSPLNSQFGYFKTPSQVYHKQYFGKNRLRTDQNPITGGIMQANLLQNSQKSFHMDIKQGNLNFIVESGEMKLQQRPSTASTPLASANFHNNFNRAGNSSKYKGQNQSNCAGNKVDASTLPMQNNFEDFCSFSKGESEKEEFLGDFENFQDDENDKLKSKFSHRNRYFHSQTNADDVRISYREDGIKNENNLEGYRVHSFFGTQLIENQSLNFNRSQNDLKAESERGDMRGMQNSDLMNNMSLGRKGSSTLKSKTIDFDNGNYKGITYEKKNERILSPRTIEKLNDEKLKIISIKKKLTNQYNQFIRPKTAKQTTSSNQNSKQLTNQLIREFKEQTSGKKNNEIQNPTQQNQQEAPAGNQVNGERAKSATKKTVPQNQRTLSTVPSSINSPLIKGIEGGIIKDLEIQDQIMEMESQFDLSEELSNPDADLLLNDELQNNEDQKLFLLQSVYEDRPPTIFFPYPKCCLKTRNTGNRVEIADDKDKKRFELKYQIGGTSNPYRCVTASLQIAGFFASKDNDWNLFWGRGQIQGLKKMNPFQKSNHFPGCWNLGRKDLMWQRVSRMKRKFPNDYQFVPQTYLLSCEWDRFLAIKEDAEKNSLWIMKPVASACGRGIQVLGKNSNINKSKKQNYLVSQYIKKTHLINEFQYDLRVYVLITSYDPLRIYFYQEGLTRFATEKYDTQKSTLKQKFVHLTNFSVNKQSQTFVQNTDPSAESEGSQWSHTALRKQYDELGIDHAEIFTKIKDLIIKTCIAVEPFMLNSTNKNPEHRSNCFELYGFDVLIDEQLQPWLLEVNVCPSLNSSSPLDLKIQTSLLSDIWNIVGLHPFDKKKMKIQKKKSFIHNLNDEQKGVQSQNLQDLHDLSQSNCIQKLTADDWEILFETEEENYRRGNFQRIFPPSDLDQIEYYQQFFEFARFNNEIVWKNLKSNNVFLEKVSRKIYNVNV